MQDLTFTHVTESSIEPLSYGDCNGEVRQGRHNVSGRWRQSFKHQFSSMFFRKMHHSTLVSFITASFSYTGATSSVFSSNKSPTQPHVT